MTHESNISKSFGLKKLEHFGKQALVVVAGQDFLHGGGGVSHDAGIYIGSSLAGQQQCLHLTCFAWFKASLQSADLCFLLSVDTRGCKK